MNIISKPTPDDIKNELDKLSIENNSLFIENAFIDFLQIPTEIKIPTKIQYIIDNYISEKSLLTIDKDINFSKELIYIFINKLTYSSIFNQGEYKNINKEHFLKSYFGSTNKIKNLNNLIEILLKGTKNGSIIECDKKYYSGSKSYGYRLTERYINKGWVKYQLTNEKLKHRCKKIFYHNTNKILTNPIALNLVKMYSQIDLPTIKEIEKEGRKLIKLGFKQKDGKELRFLKDKQKRDTSKYCYVEDAIKRFKYLTDDGYIIPSFKDENSICDRVIDSFNLMNKWVRNLIKIDGKKLVELDYSALHPNLINTIYNGNLKYITHQDIADYLNIDVKIVKIKHLSFFNLEFKDIYKSKLYKYYKEKDSEMMKRIITDKIRYGQLSTTKKLFNLEVKLMKNVIKELNKKDIYCLYIYDALLVSEKDSVLTKKIMNNNALKMNIYTNVK